MPEPSPWHSHVVVGVVREVVHVDGHLTHPATIALFQVCGLWRLSRLNLLIEPALKGGKSFLLCKSATMYTSPFMRAMSNCLPCGGSSPTRGLSSAPTSPTDSPLCTRRKVCKVGTTVSLVASVVGDAHGHNGRVNEEAQTMEGQSPHVLVLRRVLTASIQTEALRHRASASAVLGSMQGSPKTSTHEGRVIHCCHGFGEGFLDIAWIQIEQTRRQRLHVAPNR